jgi:hypothetical protein
MLFVRPWRDIALHATRLSKWQSGYDRENAYRFLNICC